MSRVDKVRERLYCEKRGKRRRLKKRKSVKYKEFSLFRLIYNNTIFFLL